MGARETALNVLIACRKEQGWSNGVLKQYIRRDRLDRREAALAARLCYGVVQNRMLMDYHLKSLLTGKLKDLHPVLRDILHLGLYQLTLMDRIPDSAAVNESVSLAKKYCPKQKSGPGLVNAVLRNALRTELTPPKGWAELYSHPQELIDLLKPYVGGKNMEAMLRANNDIAPTVIQVNTLKITTETLMEQLKSEGVEAQPHSWLSDCLVLSATGAIEELTAFQNGYFYVQDAAARLSVLCAQLPKDRDIRVLDACAAPGGKSFAAAVAMRGRGEITSCDIHEHKLQLIEKSAQRLGFSNITARLQDGSEINKDWENAMDAVIADVPCSGYGIIRKKPDIRYKDPKTMAELPDLQLAILQNQARYVKPGGVLIYSTCTLVRAENEGVLEAFLAQNPNYQLEPLPLPAVFPKNESGMLLLVPGQYDTDGFFISRLRRIK